LISGPLHQRGLIQVGQDAADGGQGQSEPLREYADGQRTVAQVLERSDVPGAQGHASLRHGLVLVPPYPAHDPREQAHQAQARRRMPARVRFRCRPHGPFDVDGTSIYGSDSQII